MIRFVDTSAALKLVIQEAESDALARDLEASRSGGATLVSSMLLFTELHCAAARRRELVADSVNAVLDRLVLVDVERVDLVTAATSAWGLRSADAIQLAAALRCEADEFVCYDVELAAAAHRAGIRVSAPGAAAASVDP